MIISWSFELHYDKNILFLGIQQLYKTFFFSFHCLIKKILETKNVIIWMYNYIFAS